MAAIKGGHLYILQWVGKDIIMEFTINININTAMGYGRTDIITWFEEFAMDLILDIPIPYQ